MPEYRVTPPGGEPIIVTADNPDDLRRKIAEMSGRTRLGAFARGLADTATFGFGDEMLAGARSVFGGDYASELADIHEGQKEYAAQFPESTLAGNVAGALGSAVLPGGVAARGATLLRGAPAAVRAVGSALGMAGSGAAGAGLYGAGSAEGGAADRLAAATDPATLAVGAAAGVVGGGLAHFVAKTAAKMGRTSARAVEREVLRLAEESGLTPDEIAARITAGEMPGEMTATLRAAVRAYRTMGGPAKGVIDDAMAARVPAQRAAAAEAVTNALGAPPGNILRAVRASQEQADATINAAYDKVWAQGRAAPEEVGELIEDALRRGGRSLKSALVAVSRAVSPDDPVMDASGKLLRTPTLQEAEVFRRTLRDQGYTLGKSGLGQISDVLRPRREQLQKLLDDSAPDLAKARSDAAVVNTAREAFDLGRKALGRSADEVEVEFNRLATPEAQAAYRQGVADAFRARFRSPRAAGTILSLGTLDGKERAILETVGLLDETAAAIPQLERSAGTEALLRRLGGSDTAESLAGQRAVGSGPGRQLIDTAAAVSSGSPLEMARVAMAAIEAGAKGLSPAERAKVAELLMAQSAEAFRDAIRRGSVDEIEALVARAAAAVRGTGAVAAGTTANAGGLIDSLGGTR